MLTSPSITTIAMQKDLDGQQPATAILRGFPSYLVDLTNPTWNFKMESEFAGIDFRLEHRCADRRRVIISFASFLFSLLLLALVVAIPLMDKVTLEDVFAMFVSLCFSIGFAWAGYILLVTARMGAVLEIRAKESGSDLLFFASIPTIRRGVVRRLEYTGVPDQIVAATLTGSDRKSVFSKHSKSYCAVLIDDNGPCFVLREFYNARGTYDLNEFCSKIHSALWGMVPIRDMSSSIEISHSNS